MDRNLGYVGMTRHREGVDLYSGRDDFKDLDELKERLSRARPKDSTLDYAQRRGLDAARAQGTEKEPTVQRQQEQKPQPEREAKERGQAQEPEAGQGDPVARFKQAQKEFIQVAGMADFDPQGAQRRTARGNETGVPGDCQGPGTHARGRTRRHRPPDQELRPPGRTRKRAREGQGNRERRRAGAIEWLLS